MKIALTHSNNLPWKEELYNVLRKASFSNENQIFFPQENDTKDLIKNSDIVLAEVSYPSTGQGIELGWANAFDTPIICFYQEGSKISNSLKKITNIFVEYSDMDDMEKKIERELLNQQPARKFS